MLRSSTEALMPSTHVQLTQFQGMPTISKIQILKPAVLRTFPVARAGEPWVNREIWVFVQQVSTSPPEIIPPFNPKLDLCFA